MENMNYPTEAEYAEVFGVGTEGSGPESGQESTQSQEGQGGSQAAETSVEGTEQPGAGENGGVEQEPGDGDQNQPTEMSPEERSEWAARRRKWEANDAQARAREEQARAAAVQARVDKAYADMFAGQNNPFTGKPITTEAEFQAYQAERTRRQQTAQMQKAGIDPQALQGMVDQQVNQQMAPFRQQMEAAKLTAIQQRARAVNMQAEASLNASLQKINAMDPQVKTLEDIRAMPTGKQVNELVQRGYALEHAFQIANQQAIDARRLAAAKAAAQNQMAGKGHLAPVSSTGKNPVQVSREAAEAFRYFNPDATDADIQKAYEAELNSK